METFLRADRRCDDRAKSAHGKREKERSERRAAQHKQHPLFEGEHEGHGFASDTFVIRMARAA
eukprot:scaffold1518_cov331-Pavlova_lutheri.AAC.46